MLPSIDNQVLDFYGELFEHLFSNPFRNRISERRRLNEVLRQVGEATDAASSSLTRFFVGQKLSETEVAEILSGFQKMGQLLSLENISNSNVTTEAIAEDLLGRLPCPQTVQISHNAIYRTALHTVVQVLMQVGPVMAEWQKLSFSITFELPRRIINRLIEISEQINALGQLGQTGADESYEIQYRDYLLQRFHKVEAGTVRMTTNMDVDLRELFVMPRIKERKRSQEQENQETETSIALMDLDSARQLFSDRPRNDRSLLETENVDKVNPQKVFPTALEQVKKSNRTVIVGTPGSGKSTFFEWLQVKIASAEEIFILGEQQAIPLMLRVRQLDLLNLPQGSAFIEKATASQDRAALMPQGWIERQMKTGRVLFLLDGLDETEPDLRDQYLFPWLFKLLTNYPNCHYLISSRPVGYSDGLLNKNKFVECDLLDFEPEQITEYTRHWCTAIRLARNESEEEARREGKEDGTRIATSFEAHPYISNLARNPLMLSAICLVNYFEGGNLPEDRALLYRLCVEGLLHNWDQRRGIHSEFSFDEKLRTCREVALAMQAEDRAEFEGERVKDVFNRVLANEERASKLLEHIRYRTGLLLERRPNIFGFAHLTFQEYLAARAIHEGNRLGVDANQLVREHDDGRWKEVIALYCGLATTPTVKDLIEQLIKQDDTTSLGEVLTEAYFSAGADLSQDQELRKKVIERVAVSPGKWGTPSLTRFPPEEVTTIANALVGTTKNCIRTSESHDWLIYNPKMLEISSLITRLCDWQNITPLQLGELIYLSHRFAPDEILEEIVKIPDLYSSTGPSFDNELAYCSQAEIVLIGLLGREIKKTNLEGFKVSFYKAIQALTKNEAIAEILLERFSFKIQQGDDLKEFILACNYQEKKKFASLIRELTNHLKTIKITGPFHRENREFGIKYLNKLVDLLEGKEEFSKPVSTKKRSKSKRR
jgi:deoxyadenosine/deoxycytidine kinase